MRKSCLPIVALCMLVVLAACQTPAGRSAGEVVDDGTITTEIKAMLLNDDITRGLAVSVQTFQGVVTLTGAVDTEGQRARATDVAYSVKGVKKVNNLVEIRK